MMRADSSGLSAEARWAKAGAATLTLPRPTGRGGRSGALLATLGALVLVFMLFELAIGPVWIPIGTILAALTGQPIDRAALATIIWDLRLPRVLTAAIAGAALGLAGLQMQTLFRNPLADPWFLGIVGGARVGVATLVTVLSLMGADALREWRMVAVIGTAVAAIAGAATALMLLSAAATRVSVVTLLILGLVLDYMASGYVSALLHFSTETQGKVFASWNDGSFGAAGWRQLAVLAALIAIGSSLAVGLVKSLNALLLGETYAHSLGVSVSRVRRVVLASTSLLAGGVTAFCGPISFLGVASPHLCRAIFRSSDHRLLMPAVMLMGALLALAGDFVTNLPWERHFLHLNAVLALLGGPVVVWVVLKRVGRSELM
jgi:iron complex transport system permease protein